MEYLSSMYIDDEMDLDEKRLFLEKIRFDQAFYALTLDLLAQEQLLQRQTVIPEPGFEKKWQPPARINLLRYFKPLGFATAGFAAAILMMFFTVFQPRVPALQNNRFVIFEPGAGQVELAGSFTGWQRISMNRIGNSGYWELNLPVTSGEHRFAYILDGNLQIADPTLAAREKDDFGGENSILNVTGHI
ncbi:MAG: glycogen-binding domain-containing protein [Desulfobacula sp.]|jgi:hypothetical protein